MPGPLQQLREASSTLIASAEARGIEFDASGLSSVGDEALLRLVGESEALRRAAEAVCTRLAGELTARSAREAGNDGLAARNGYRDPAAFLARVTGSSTEAAVARGQLGVALTADHFAAVGLAVDVGDIAADAAVAIVKGLRPVSSATSGVPREEVLRAVDDLLALAKQAPADEVRRASRGWLDRLDPLRASAREDHLRDQRYLRFGRERDGLTPIHGLLDPESAGWVRTAFDVHTNPRRRSVTFETEEIIAARDRDGDRELALASDGRSLDQIRADALVGMARASLNDGRNRKTAGIRPTLLVTVTLEELRSGLGSAGILGTEEPVSAATARRLAADADLIPIVLGTKGQVLDFGRRHRSFTDQQRLLITLRDGGCAIPDCSALPLHCEVHHIEPWERGGCTNLRNGVLLCPWHHHLLDRGWTLGWDGTHAELNRPPGNPRR